MSKKFMHIMVDDILTNEESNNLSASLNDLSDKYDIAITSNKFQIDISDPELMQNINDKLDIIINNIDSLNDMRNDIRSDIKYVFGITNKSTNTKVNPFESLNTEPKTNMRDIVEGFSLATKKDKKK